MTSMTDDERDCMDMDSEDDDFGDDGDMGYDKISGSSTPNKPMTQAEKRAHHNMLERKRRDHIKDSFVSLRDSVPSLQGEKSSRAQILKKAAEYIQFMRRKNSAHQHDIEDLKRQNHILENQTKLAVRTLERARVTGSSSGSGNGSGLRSNPSGSTSPIDMKPSLASLTSKSVSSSSKSNSRSSESHSDNSDGDFRMTSSPESATSSSNLSLPVLSIVHSNSNGGGPTKKLKVLNPAK